MVQPDNSKLIILKKKVNINKKELLTLYFNNIYICIFFI